MTSSRLCFLCVHPNCVTQVYRLDNKQSLCVLSHWPAAGMNQTVQVTVLLHSGDEILLLRRWDGEKSRFCQFHKVLGWPVA